MGVLVFIFVSFSCLNTRHAYAQLKVHPAEHKKSNMVTVMMSELLMKYNTADNSFRQGLLVPHNYQKAHFWNLECWLYWKQNIKHEGLCLKVSATLNFNLS